ncbi:hypothetical protein EHF33_20295 (plasmid) [Deinococcus psychrotolerans]|uniref:Uncharacterized protein n=1 Tax=Deinococcus psychrotolerans TaxID=2489213 RepID=A0A3G8YUG4_9DEIO|nr:hypothetical protein [Deinococcus psychrotolerans]AZI45251.1 hypothetical protein EHF33_20295 [Deinococcus psychrotolerans]
MLTPFQQELQHIERFKVGLHTAQPAHTSPAADDVERRIDAVCAQVHKHLKNAQAGTSLVNVRRSAREEVNADKMQLASELDALLQTLAAPTELVAEVLEIYLPGYAQGDYPVTHGTRSRASLTPTTALPVGVFGEMSPLNIWGIPGDSPLRDQLTTWVELHQELKAQDSAYQVLDADQAYLLSSNDADSVLESEADWDGQFLSQVLNVTDLSSGEVQVLNLTAVTLQGNTWQLNVDADLPYFTPGAVVRLTTSDGSVSGDLLHHSLEVLGRQLRVVDLTSINLQMIKALTLEDIAQVTVLHGRTAVSSTHLLN